MSKLWFKRKRYGWGWFPVSWEGWAVVVVYIAAVVGLARFFAWYISAKNPHPLTFTALVIAAIAVLIGALVKIGYTKGERPEWSWGKKRTDEQEHPKQ